MQHRTTRRLVGEHKWDYLTRLVNCFGANELCVCYNYPIGESESGKKVMGFSKWVKVMDLWHLGPNDKIPGHKYPITRKEFIHRATHRTLLPQEVMIDLDDLSSPKDIEFLDMKTKLQWVLSMIDKPYSVYYSGSRGYHVSKLNGFIGRLDTYNRRMYKEIILSQLCCDTQKSIEKSMIALEGTLHWKSNKYKSEVLEWD